MRTVKKFKNHAQCYLIKYHLKINYFMSQMYTEPLLRTYSLERAIKYMKETIER